MVIHDGPVYGTLKCGDVILQWGCKAKKIDKSTYSHSANKLLRSLGDSVDEGESLAIDLLRFDKNRPAREKPEKLRVEVMPQRISSGGFVLGAVINVFPPPEIDDSTFLPRNKTQASPKTVKLQQDPSERVGGGQTYRKKKGR
jgi:hypothetical protein